MIKVLIVDDEKPSRDELRYLLADIGEIEIAGEAEDGIEAVKMIAKLDLDIIFLDIQMPEMSGIELAESLQKMENKPYIVFTTAYDSFAIKAFEIGALDYLLKPYSSGRIKKSIDRYKTSRLAERDNFSDKINELLSVFSKEENSSQPFRITVSRGDNFRPLKLEDIVAVIASGKKTRIVTMDAEYEDSKTITQFEEILSDESFFRCHRSYLINLNYIEKIGIWFNNTYQLTMGNLTERVPVSRSRVREFRKLMSIE